MATFHLHTKPISRKGGRSATASSAYRAGVKIEDKRTGLTHDFSNRSGVVDKGCFMFQDGEKITLDRSEVWNIAEQHEKRKDSRTAREIVINLPHELTKEQRHDLVKDFTENVAKKYNVAIDYAIHLPDKEGDQRNHHSHILMTTRTAELNENKQLTLGDKTAIELGNKDLKKLGLPTSQEQITELRAEWAETTNRHLERAGIAERIDHRSFEEQGKDQLPTIKMGWKSTEAERLGVKTIRGEINRQIRATNEIISELKQEITADNMRLENYTTLENIDNKAIPDTLRKNLANTDFPKLEQFATHNAKKLEELNDKAEIEPLSPADIERYTLAKGIAKGIEEMRNTGVWQEKAHQAQEIKKQSEVTAVTEPKPQTVIKPPSEPLEPNKNNSARVVPPTPPKEPQSGNKPHSEPKPQTLKEYLTGLAKEERQKAKDFYNKIINEYVGAINQKAVELYHKATPPNKREKPLFSHYKEHDMEAVQPYKKLAQQEIHKADPSKYEKYNQANDILKEINSIEQNENLQKQLDRMQDRSQTRTSEPKR